MKKNIVGELISKAAYKTAQKKVNEICGSIFYQPEIPEVVKRLKRKNDKQAF